MNKATEGASPEPLIGDKSAFHAAVDEAVQGFRDTETPFSLILFDGDRFKQINDTYGHDGGDVAIEHLAQCALSVLEAPQERCFRLGGDEFGLILRGADLGRACQVAQSLVERVRETPIVFNQDTFFMTVSAGVAHVPSHAESTERAIKRADQAAYMAKWKGRDGFCVFNRREYQDLYSRHGSVERLRGASIRRDDESSNYAVADDARRLRIQADLLEDFDCQNIRVVLERLRADEGTPLRVLDAGCGDGYVTFSRFDGIPNIHVVGLDRDPACIRRANRLYDEDNFEFCQGDLSQHEFEPESFDLIFTAYTLHHLSESGKVLQKLWSWLKPGGAIMIRTNDDANILLEPAAKELQELVKLTANVRGQSDRRHGRRVGHQLGQLNPRPAESYPRLNTMTTNGMTRLGRADFYDDVFGWRANSIRRFAQTPEARDQDRELARRMTEIIESNRQPFIEDSQQFALTAQYMWVAIKPK